MNAFDKAMNRSNALIHTTQAHAMQVKGFVSDSMVTPSMLATGGMDWASRSKNRESYAYFHSWVYSAVNALASEAATQPFSVGKLKGGKSKKTPKNAPGRTKSHILHKLPINIRHKAAERELEVLADHSLMKILERPNPIQFRYQFVYSIVANLNLTGRAYIVRDKGEDGPEFYALPTTWVRPDHEKGPFSRFYIVNPHNPTGFEKDSKPLDASQVAMIYLPNPSDPMGAISPSNCMSAAIRVDDRIQTCQEKFFDNGIFPSVVVTIGKDPHPDVPGGVRPRLTGTQRRQVTGAIRRVMGGIANYGNPAIVDGLIENISRLSSTQTELGWDKSEDKLKTRILSAFCVHPFILGEPAAVGGYAQTFNIEKRFCARINTFLDLLSTVMTYFLANSIDEAEEEDTEDDLLVWWEPKIPVDPSLEDANYRFARTNNDVSQNEFRAKMGLPPKEEEVTLNVPLTSAIAQLLGLASGGGVKPDQIVALLEANGVDTELATRIAGPEIEVLPSMGPPNPEESLPAAVDALNKAIAELHVDPLVEVDNIMKQLGYKG